MSRRAGILALTSNAGLWELFMADARELNTIVSDIHSHGKDAVQPELSRLKDNLDRGDSKQFQQDLLCA